VSSKERNTAQFPSWTVMLAACTAVVASCLAVSAARAELSPLVNLTRPKISGIAEAGLTLHASRGSWSNNPTSYAYTWRRCNALGGSCVAITGAIRAGYLLGSADIGRTLRVTVIAYNAAGHSSATSVPTSVVKASTSVHHLEYVFNDGPVEVYDIDHPFRLVETFSLPGTTRGVRGVAVSPSTDMMFVSFGGDGGGNGDGSVLAYNLVTKEVAWSVNLNSGIDSGAVSNDGKLLYMPCGELCSTGTWNVMDTSTGAVVGTIVPKGTGPHDGVMSADGKVLLLGNRNYPYASLYNTATKSLQPQIGPLIGGVRPLTIDGTDHEIFTTATGFDGFQVSSSEVNSVLYTESFGPIPPLFPFSTASHGISLSPDSSEVYVIDAVHKEVQAWDVHGVRLHLAPKLVAAIPVNGLTGTEAGCAYDCGRDGWLQHTLDGRYVFVGDSGAVIETATHTVVANLANLLNTRKMIEIDWSNGVPIASSGRTGVGHSG
jgi:DNA-binding beta-propeller fold protein YncE